MGMGLLIKLDCHQIKIAQIASLGFCLIQNWNISNGHINYLLENKCIRHETQWISTFFLGHWLIWTWSQNQHCSKNHYYLVIPSIQLISILLGKYFFFCTLHWSLELFRDYQFVLICERHALMQNFVYFQIWFGVYAVIYACSKFFPLRKKERTNDDNEMETEQWCW